MLLPKLVKAGASKRFISSTAYCLHRVAVIGAAGGIGKALVMLLKANPRVSDMSLMDVQNTAGIAADISHIDTFSGVHAFSGAEQMEKSLSCVNLLVVVAGKARTGDSNRAGLFDANKEFIYKLTMAKANICPEAFMVIVTNPVNALVPLAAETLKQANAHDPKKLFGVSKLDTMRAKTFIGDRLLIDPYKVQVTVVGGHSNNTIVPIISSATPKVPGDQEDLQPTYDRIRNGGTEVLKAKGGKETAQLSIAYATSLFCGSILAAMDGKNGVVDVAYVESDVCNDVTFFSSSFELKKDGIAKFHTLPDMNEYEQELLQKAIPELQKSAEQGVKYAQSLKDKKG